MVSLAMSEDDERNGMPQIQGAKSIYELGGLLLRRINGSWESIGP